MPDQHLRRNRRTFSASYAVETVGTVLLGIKSDDNLTFTELGTILGKSKDQAERIAKGNAVMDMPTFLRACDYWGERFADKVLALTGLRTAPSGSICSTDPVAGTMAALLTRAIEAEHPDSPGGIEVIDREVLEMDEAVVRRVHRTTGHWIATIDNAKGPRLPLKAVAR